MTIWLIVTTVFGLLAVALMAVEVWDGRRERAHLPVDIDRYTRATRARARRAREDEVSCR